MLSPEGETSVYRIAQEGLNNVVKALPRDRGQNPDQEVRNPTGHLGQDNGNGIPRPSLTANGNSSAQDSAWRGLRSECVSSVVLLQSTPSHRAGQQSLSVWSYTVAPEE